MIIAMLLAAAAEGILTLMDALVKAATARLGIVEITFLRFAMGALWAGMLFAILRPGRPSRDALKVNALRAILVVPTAGLFFYAVSVLPLADAIALGFLSPIFMALLAALLLGERLDWRIGVALAAGFTGMLIIVGGRLGGTAWDRDAWLGAGAVVVSALLYAFITVLLRARATRDPLATIVLFQNLGPALLLAPVAWWYGRWPAPNDLALFAFVGLLGVAGHICLVRAFARAEAARLAPVHYTTLVWGVLLGWVMFGDVPGPATLAGAAVIVAASLVARRG